MSDYAFPQAPSREEGQRHWSPESQAYATVDLLQQFLRDAWNLRSIVVEEINCSGSFRCVEVFRCRLIRGQESIELPVLSNPVILRIIREYEPQLTYTQDDLH